MEQSEDNLILESFKKFVIESNLINAEDLDATIDEVIGSYIVNTINQFYEEYESHKIWLDDNAEEEFDIENFSDVIDAYLNGFIELDKNKIIKWLIKLKKDIDRIRDSKKFSPRVDSSQETQTVIIETVRNEIRLDKKEVELDSDLQVLVEMFPNISLKEISKVYKKLNKDNGKAIEELLLIQNTIDEVITQNDELTEEEKKMLKEKTVQKFGMVEVKEDGSPIEVKPKFVWNSEKKLVRYYENKVVSTKGEKKFEYKTEKDEQMEKEMKKTYINLKPARKYRFH